MSQLETNATDLRSILAQVNALPDAGSGGGGASVETCTVTCSVSLPGRDPVEIYYIDGAGESQIADFLAVGTITVQKNSYLFINGWSETCGSSGNILQKIYGFGHALFYVTGDATLDFQA